MGIKKVEEGWLADFYNKGKRYRKVFEVRSDARDFETTIKYGFSKEPVKDKGILIAKAIREYVKIESENKMTAGHDKKFLTEFYDFLTIDQGLECLSEVQLFHLNKYQALLRSDSERKALAVKSFEAARKENVEPIRLRLLERAKDCSGLKDSSINRVFATLKDFFKHCRKWGFIPFDPFNEFEFLQADSDSHKPWPSNEGIQGCLDHALPHYRKPLFLVADSGMRPIGVTRMTKDHVDLINKRFCVISYKGNGGKKRVQWLPMTERQFEFFKEVIAEVNKRPSNHPYRDLLFLSATGLPIRSNTLSRWVSDYAKSVGLHGYTLYGWRHFVGTFTANPDETGEYQGSLETARQVLGHATLVQTQVYNHKKEKQVKSDLESISKLRGLTWKGGTEIVRH